MPQQDKLGIKIIIMKYLLTITYVLTLALILNSCSTISPIKRYDESTSNFSEPPELMSNNYPKTNIYRIFQQASSGFTSLSKLRSKTEERINKFATQQGKSYIILGEKASKPPYIFGNFPKIEMVFVLIDKPK